MPATDNSAVQITINVVDGATGETISRVTKSLDQLGEAGARNGQKLKQGMQEVGRAGEAVGPTVGKGMKEAGAHTLTSLDSVRLLRDDLGIRIPRAMEIVISKSAALSAAIGAVGTGLIALGAIEIGVRLGTQLYEIYKKYVDINGQVDEFKKKLGEAAQQKFFDVASIETVNLNLEKTNALMGMLQSSRTNLGSGGLLQMTLPAMFGGQGAGLKELIAAYTNVKKEEAGLSQQDDDQRRVMEDKHKAALQTIRDNKERASSAGEAAAAAAALNARTAEAGENRRYTRQQEHFENGIKMRGKGIFDPSDPRYIHDTPNAGDDQFQRDTQSAQIEYQAGRTKQGIGQREQADHALADAGMSGLVGEPLYWAQRQEELRKLTVEATKTGMADDVYRDLRYSIITKALEEQKKRRAEENAQTAQLDAEAGLGGKTGLAKSDQELRVKLAALQKESPKFSDPATLAQRTTDAKLQSSASQKEAEQGFTDRLADLDAGRSDRYASEGDKITASATKTVLEIRKAWEHLYGGLGALDIRYVQSQMALNEEIAKIHAEAARQRQEAGQRVEDETRKLEDQARRQGLPKYQQETAAIVDDYNERIQKLEELRAKDAANADRYRRQELAEEQIKNGKLVEQQRALRDRLAGQLQGLFSNPLEALKRQGEQAAAKYAADLLVKFAPKTTAAIVNGGKGGDGAFGLPSIFGSGFGGKHPKTFDHGASQAGSGTHNDNPAPSSTAAPQISSNSSTLTASSASISVGSATISGNISISGGGGGGGTTAPGAAPATSVDAGAAAASVGAATEAAAPSARVPSSDAGSSTGTAASVEAGASTAATAAGTADKLSKGGLKAWANKIPGVGKLGGNIGGIAGGGLGLYSAIEGKGGFGGALSGAFSGAKLGSILGGPIGAGIGAVIGAGLGIFGFGARAKAAEYDRKTVKPRLANDLSSFEAGQSDYQSVYEGFSSLMLEAKQQTKSFGPGASSYYDGTIVPEIKLAQTRLSREAKAGRAEFGFSAAQFHQGGILRDFGSMATSPTEGWVHAQRDEIMLNQQAAMRHADAAMLMNSGASRSQMAEYYGGGSSSGTRVAQSSGGGDVHFNVSAVDARGVQQFFDEHGHKIRAALNKSYAENSGGGDYA